VHGTKLYNLATGGRGPRLSVAELHALGFQWIVMPGLAMGAVLDGVRRAAVAALRDGNDEAIASTGFEPERFFAIAGLAEWRELESTYAMPNGGARTWA
jgi:2,3-dimethylmalate lyase